MTAGALKYQLCYVITSYSSYSSNQSQFLHSLKNDEVGLVETNSNYSEQHRKNTSSCQGSCKQAIFLGIMILKFV